MIRACFGAITFLWFGTAANAFEPTINVQQSLSLRPQVYGKTNLPDGAVLTFMMSRPEIQYVAQQKMVVKNGKFYTVGISDRGGALKPGRYTVEIALVASGLNPPNVRAVIGDRGENMSGQWVHPGVIDAKEFTYHGVIDVASPSPPPTATVERSPYLERAIIDRCEEMVYTKNEAVESGALPGIPARGAALREKVRECIRTAIPAESAGFVLERYDSEG
jgi:hypothetical protein